MIRLIFTDVDGTMIGTSGEPHPAVWRAATRAREAGLPLVMCTGRPGFGVTRRLAEQLDPTGWHVFQNGASIVHLPTRRSLSTPLPPELVEMLVQRARTSALDLELYTDHEYAIESGSERVRQHAQLLGVPFVQRPFESLDDPIVRGQWILTTAEAEVVLAEPHPGLEVSPSTSPVFPDMLFVNLTLRGVNKASAVQTIANEHRVALDRVMFIGDGWNDTVAMKIVGHPVAVANAEPEALAIAEYTVGHVDEGGLAQAFERAIELMER